MDCCQKTLTEYILKEALSMCTEMGGERFAQQMIRGAGISTDNPGDLEIMKSIGPEAVDMVRGFGM